MKRTYNINMSGMVFVIDEDAYAMLNDYTQTLQKAFDETPEGREVAADIECRMAELFAEYIEMGNNVLTLPVVQAVVARMGRPEEMVEDDFSFSSVSDGGIVEKVTVKERTKATPPPYTGPAYVPKKLFRDPRNAMLGGVCSGLAWYTGMDVTWVRLLAVLLAFGSLSAAAVAYVVMWIVVPEARTPLQRMQMMGEAPTVDNIGRTVAETYRTDEETPQTPNTFGQSLANFFGVMARIAMVFVLVIASIIVVSLGIALLGCIIALVIFTTSWGVDFWNIGHLPELSLITDMPIVPILVGIGWILTIGIPLFALCWLIFTRDSGRTMRSGWKTALVITWILGFLLAAVTTGIIVSY